MTASDTSRRSVPVRKDPLNGHTDARGDPYVELIKQRWGYLFLVYIIDGDSRK